MTKKAIAALLAACIIALSPGPLVHQAAAQVMAVSVQAPVSPSAVGAAGALQLLGQPGAAPSAALQGPALGSGVSLPSLSSPRLEGPRVQARAAAAAAQSWSGGPAPLGPRPGKGLSPQGRLMATPFARTALSGKAEKGSPATARMLAEPESVAPDAESLADVPAETSRGLADEAMSRVLGLDLKLAEPGRRPLTPGQAEEADRLSKTLGGMPVYELDIEPEAGTQGAVLAGEAPQAPPPAPRAKPPDLKRYMMFGLVFAAVQLGLELVAPPLASSLFGWMPHPSYGGALQRTVVAPASEYILSALQGTFAAPVIEELLFRGGIMGFLIKALTPELGKAAPWAAMLINSVVFAALHETADPLFFAVRLIGSLLLSYAAYSEGIRAAIAQHALHNGYWQALALSRVFLGAEAVPFVRLGLTALYAALAVLFWIRLRPLKKSTAMMEDR